MNVEELNDEVEELKTTLANVNQAHEKLKQTVRAF
jgi:ribosomal protein L29